MAKIDTYLEFVKEQVAVQEKLSEKYGDSPYRRELHLKSAKNFADLANFLAELQSRGTRDTAYLNRGDSPLKRMGLTYEDIDGAPEDLLRELSLTEADKQDLLTEYIIAQAGGVLSLDKVMVELWKRLREVPIRNTLTSRLYRMVGKKMIYNVPGKKGYYSTYELTEQDTKKMFGQVGEETTEEAPAATPQTAASPSPAPPKAPPKVAAPNALAQIRTRLMTSGAETGERRR
jgi:hypothetical protein